MSALRAVSATEQRSPLNRLTLVTSSASLMARSARIVVGGLIGTVLLGLVLNVFIAQSVYEKARLKQTTSELGTSAQVLREQVDSLASNQNLEQAAHDLGMVSNANPVFIDISSKKVFGKPRAATVGASLSGNLVANSALSATTDVSTLKAKTAARQQALAAASAAAKLKAAAKQTSNVAAAKTVVKKVSLPSSGIPGSPTH